MDLHALAAILFSTLMLLVRRALGLSTGTLSLMKLGGAPYPQHK